MTIKAEVPKKLPRKKLPDAPKRKKKGDLPFENSPKAMFKNVVPKRGLI